MKAPLIISLSILGLELVAPIAVAQAADKPKMATEMPAHLPPNIPTNNFWSFTLYDSQSRSMLQTDQQFPAVGSLTKGIVANADKSFDVYFGPKAPAGQENNK